MASSFQRYSGQGIQPVTGMAEAGANIGKMYAQGLGQLGEAIGQGIKVYGENQQKSQMADAKLASGIKRFKQISSIYAQDPEFAPVVASFADRMAAYQDAPNQSLSKKLVMANDIDSMVGELASTIQAQQVVRARQVERIGGEALMNINGKTTVTDPAIIGENVMKFDTSKTYDQNQSAALEGLNRFRQAAQQAGKEIKGTDADFLDMYRRNIADSTNKAMTAGSLDKNVGSKILEQIEAVRGIEKSNARAESDMPVLPSMAKSKRSDYEAAVTPAYQPTAQDKEKQSASEQVIKAYAPSKKESETRLKSLEQEKQALLKKVEEDKATALLQPRKSPVQSLLDNLTDYSKQFIADKIADYSKIDEKGNVVIDYGKVAKSYFATTTAGATGVLLDQLSQEGPSKIDEVKIKTTIDKGLRNANSQRRLEEIEANIKSEKELLSGIQTASGIKPDVASPKAPVVGLGKQSAGFIESERDMNQAERKAKVAEFLTSRIGMTDPKTGQKVLPSGFDSWYKGMVPESDARVVDVDGVKLLWNGKGFEQVKAATPPSTKEIREGMIGVYGNQTADGRLVPEEFIPDSGVFFSGILRGNDTADKEFKDEQSKLIESRSSVKRLQEINDKAGEAFSPSLRGEADVHVMVLSSALRRDIVGVGSVSDYENKLIKKVIDSPATFFSLESKDRAILLALAERIDRKIISNGAKYGLKVEIKDNGGRSRYASLREKFLAEKLK